MRGKRTVRKYVLCMLLLLLLTACQSTSQQAESPTPEPMPTLAATVTPTPEPTPSPTPEPTSVGIEVDVGDGEHKFWVELTDEGEEKRVNIYEKQGDVQPIQTFEDTEGFVSLSRAGLTAEDVNFDGYMDFHFYTSFGYSIVSHSSYYVWDPAAGCFVPDPYGLNDLSTAEFQPYTKEVSSLSRGPMGTLVTSYQYENGALVEVGESFYPEEDSPEKAYTARWVTVDERHTFWVKLARGESQEECEICIYREKDDEDPAQSFEDTISEYIRLELSSEDMDFDGDTDFGVLYSEAPNGHASFSYYIWDEKEEKFIPDPYGLNELCSVGEPELLPEEKAIRTFMRSNAGRSGEVRFYRYLPESFTCVRKMDWEWNEDTDYTDFLVESYENGEMRIVYQDSLAPEALDGYLWSDEFSNWWDLSYPGE